MKDVLLLITVLAITVLYFITSFVIAGLVIKLAIALSLKQFLTLAVVSLTLLLVFISLFVWVEGK